MAAPARPPTFLPENIYLPVSSSGLLRGGTLNLTTKPTGRPPRRTPPRRRHPQAVDSAWISGIHPLADAAADVPAQAAGRQRTSWNAQAGNRVYVPPPRAVLPPGLAQGSASTGFIFPNSPLIAHAHGRAAGSQSAVFHAPKPSDAGGQGPYEGRGATRGPAVRGEAHVAPREAGQGHRGGTIFLGAGGTHLIASSDLPPVFRPQQVPRRGAASGQLRRGPRQRSLSPERGRRRGSGRGRGRGRGRAQGRGRAKQMQSARLPPRDKAAAADSGSGLTPRTYDILRHSETLHTVLASDAKLRSAAERLHVEMRGRVRAVVTVQRMWRGLKARREWGDYIRARRAAMSLQRVARGWMARRRVRAWRVREASACCIQRGWRCSRARVRARARARLRASALRLQTAVRGWIARRALARARRERALVVKVQARWRAWRVRLIPRGKRRRVAATRVQAAARGWLGRRRGREQRARAHAAPKMQAAARGWLGRRRAREHRARVEATHTAQRVVRGWLGRRRAWRARALREMVVAVQRVWRGVRGRRRAAEARRRLRATRLLQRAGRGMLGRRIAWEPRQRVRATRLLQRAGRGMLGRREATQLRQEREAFVEGLEPLQRGRHGRSGWYRVPNTATIYFFAVSPRLLVWEWRPLVGPVRASRRVKWVKKASEAGVLQALPGTEQGSTGLYVNKKGRVRKWLVTAKGGWVRCHERDLAQEPPSSRVILLRRPFAEVIRKKRAARRIQTLWRQLVARRRYLHIRSLIVRTQARWRGVMVRQASRVVAERRAVAAGVLAALPRTVPGRTGWYGVDGECFYCVVRAGESGADWAMLYGPEDEETVMGAAARAAAEGVAQPLDCDTAGTGFYINGETKLFYSRAREGRKDAWMLLPVEDVVRLAEGGAPKGGESMLLSPS